MSSLVHKVYRANIWGRRPFAVPGVAKESAWNCWDDALDKKTRHDGFCLLFLHQFGPSSYLYHLLSNVYHLSHIFLHTCSCPSMLSLFIFEFHFLEQQTFILYASMECSSCLSASFLVFSCVIMLGWLSWPSN